MGRFNVPRSGAALTMHANLPTRPPLLACLAAGMVLASTGWGQVQSLTLGIDVNSPYGLGEAWFTVRSSLERLEFVASVAEQPDRKTSTGELRTKYGQLPDPDVLARALRESGAGASLRGVEAVVDGKLARGPGHFNLHLPGTNAALRLKPLRELVQGGRQATDAEKRAFENLTAQWKGQQLRARVVGPIVRINPGAAPGNSLALEVRKFEFLPGK